MGVEVLTWRCPHALRPHLRGLTYKDGPQSTVASGFCKNLDLNKPNVRNFPPSILGPGNDCANLWAPGIYYFSCMKMPKKFLSLGFFVGGGGGSANFLWARGFSDFSLLQEAAVSCALQCLNIQEKGGIFENLQFKLGLIFRSVPLSSP